MLVEVATSGLEPTDISTPLRTSLKRTRILRSKVTSIDLEASRVRLSEEGPQSGLDYDHLVVALGSVSNWSGNTAVAESAYEFKTLSDAIRIRNHVIDVFERADAELNSDRRQALLTFVVAGASTLVVCFRSWGAAPNHLNLSRKGRHQSCLVSRYHDSARSSSQST